MRVPQVKERVKESPASALRAMFAGIGSILFVKDKIRHKGGTENSAPETGAAAPADAAALPLPNYDELTIASLRARLRNLTAEQLTVLIEYEKAHANREDVVTMFERRITKLALGLTQALPKVSE
jgi:hypothetical protein